MKSSLLFISIKRLVVFALVGLLFLLVLPENVQAQTPGLIYDPVPGGSLILDPNADGYTSPTTAGFSVKDQGASYSEIPYVPLVFPMVEPSSDLAIGPNCSFTDFVDSGVEDPAQYYLDGSNNWLFRLRMGKTSPNSKSYSVLIDTDGKFGKTGPNADPTYTTSNPGFEIEIVLATNFGVSIFNVDNSVCGVAFKSYPGHTNYQKSISLSQICGDPDYFYDFFVNFDDITAQFPSVTPSTKIRMAIVDNMAANKSTLCNQNSASDIGGTDCTGPLENCFGQIIDNYSPCATSGSPCLDRTPCPTVTSPIYSGAVSVSGTSGAANGTTIKVYINGTAYGTTTTVTGGAWTLSGISPALVANDVIGASATTTGMTESYINCSSVIVASSCVISANPTSAYFSGKSIQGIALQNDIIKVYNPAGVLQTPTAGHIWSSPPATITASGFPSGLSPTSANFLWKNLGSGETTNDQASGGNTLIGAYRVTATSPGKCESPGVWICAGGATATANPTISTNPILPTTTSVSGSVTSPDNVAGVIIYLFSNDIQIGTTTTTTGGAWTLSGFSFSSPVCQNYTVTAVNTGKCMSSSVPIQRKAYAPVVNGPICSAAAITSVSGTSVEAAGTTIEVFEGATSKGTTTVLSDGTWTKSGISIALGTTVTAKASGSCLATSDASNSVFVGTKSTNTVTINTATPIYECDASVSGTGTNGDLITLYQDGFQIGGTTTVSGGTWTIGSLDTYCYLGEGGVVTATAATPGKCEGNTSNAVTVVCRPPLKNQIVTPSSIGICSGSTVDVTVASSQSGIVYQLFNGVSTSGTSKLSAGGSLTLTSGPVISSTSLTIKAYNVGSVNCYESVLDNSVAVTVNNPTFSSQPSSSSQSLCKDGAATSLPVTAVAGIGTISKYEWYSNVLNSNVGGNLVATHNSTSTTDSYTPSTATVGSLYYYCVVTNSIGCTVTSAVSGVVTIKEVPTISVGGVTNPVTCGINGSIVLNFTNVPDGTYNISYSTGSFNSVVVSGNTTSISAQAGTYSNLIITVNGCTSAAGVDATVTDPSAPLAPTVGTITQPTCSVATGSVVLSGLPATGTWTINPGLVTGSGTSTTISGLTASTTYNFTVTNSDGCTSAASADVPINAQPATPSAPTVGTVTQPTCSVATGSFTITNYNASYTYLVSPSSGVTVSGSGITAPEGSYTVTATLGSCTSASSASVTVNAQPLTPVITNPGAQAACDSYTLPTILGSNLSGSEAYYNNSQALGGTVITGAITSTQTVWIYDTNGSCSDEESFVVTITNTPVITNPGAQAACDSYTLPTILGSNLSGSEAYYNDSKANNGTVITGAITSTQTVWIYDTNGSCSDEESFAVTITNTPVITNPGAQAACDSYTLPAITGTNLVAAKYYDKSQAAGGTVITGPITGTQTVWIYDTNGSCSDEESFVVTINAKPAAPIVGTIVLPTCSTSTGSVELSGLPSESWIINPGNISGSAASYTITGLAQGATYNFTVSLASTGCTSDASANVAIYESCPPTVDIQGEPATVNTLASYYVTIKFSENVTGFTIADIAVGNGTASNFVAVDGNTYTVDITPSGIAGNITIDVAAAIAKDLANNDNIAAIQAVTLYDSTVPSVAILNAPVAANNVSAYTVTFEFSENVTGFSLDDITVANGTSGNFVSIGGNTYTADITPSGIAGNITIDVAASVAKDLAGNDNTAAIQAVTLYDSSAPGVVILGAPASVNNKSSYPVTIKFTENVTGFTSDDIAIGHGVLNNFTVIDGSTYTVDVTPSGNGNITLDIPAGVAQDIAGNGNLPASQVVIIFQGAGVSVSAITGHTTEAGGTATFFVFLTSIPTSDVVIGLSSSKNTEGSIFDTSLTFTSLDWNVPQIVLVTGQDDVVFDGDINYTIITSPVSSVDPNYNGLNPDDVPVINEDNEVAGIVLSKAVATTNENGSTDEFTVSLASQPLNDVQISITSEDVTEGTVSLVTLDFASSAWNIPQKVVITGVDDALYDGDISYNVTVSIVAANSDLLYSSVADQTVLVTNIDDEDPTNNTAPVVSDFSKTGNEDEILIFATSNFISHYFDLDGNPLAKIRIVTVPANGILKLEGVAITTGSEILQAGISKISFTPDKDWNGSTSFNWNGYDGTAYAAADAKVNITILSVNDAPLVFQVLKSGLEDTDRTFIAADFTNKFADVDGNSLVKIKIESLPVNGTLKLNTIPVMAGDEILLADLNKIIFSPDKDWNGSTSFNWNGFDGNTYASVVSQVNIQIQPVNDLPVSVADKYTVNEGAILTIDVPGVLANDIDVDGDVLKAVLVYLPEYGSLTLNTDGSFKYIHNGSETTSDEFTYKTNDGTAAGNLVNVAIKIIPVNDSPIAVNDNITVYERTAYQGSSLLENDSDSEGDLLTISTIPVIEPLHGTLTIYADGTFVYNPFPNYLGPDNFTYRVCDDGTPSNCSTATVTIDIVQLVDTDNDGIPDIIECPSGINCPDTDGDGIPDYQDTDADGDGIPDVTEGTGDPDGDGIPNYLDPDSDGDGIPDITEGTDDPDGDGIPNYQDTDSDGDGIPDSVEGTGDPDGDGIPNYLDPDSDGDGIPDVTEGTGDPDGDGIPNYQDTDSDGDGIPDSVEGIGDPDGDGIPNYLDTDSDGDGIPDVTEGTGDPDGDGIPNYLDTDSDGDGIPDVTEGTGDPDGDGIPNYLDADSDGDGIPDITEGTGDPDGDGIPNYLDTDSDGDGISDLAEGTGDPDGDGIPNYLDTDSDGDGIPDSVEGTGDPDGDGIPNYLDTDSDGDGIPDETEGTGDPDGDGIPNYLDTDSDGDGIPDVTEGTGDSDGDGTLNYLDTDSDGDGIPDQIEGTGDPDGDGIPNYLDLDSDGDSIPDSVEGSRDTDGDGIPNYLDTDSDGDGIPDSVEGTIDTDGDGIPNYLDTDSDGDGIPDSVEGDWDADGDGIPNYLDLDADGDGIPDSIEGTGDVDGDGIPNFLDPDSDGDDIPDSVEGTDDFDGDGIPNYQDTDSDADGYLDVDEGLTDADQDGQPDYLDPDSDGLLPNQIFTPNGDGQNDTFIIYGIEAYPNSRVTIFNRWGSVVYEKIGYQNDWDGNSNMSKVGSKPLPVGTYYYVINYDQNKHKTGFVYLER
ncbi:MAG: tandem-95 repeat protein [Prolixibacteraceae bacterium]